MLFSGVKYSTLKNVMSDCYIASKLESQFDDNGNEIEVFDKPEKFKFNIQPITNLNSNSSEIQAFGELANRMKVAVILDRNKYENKFKEFDAVYLDGITPKGENSHGKNANYRVYSVTNQNVVIKVYFLKIVK